MIPKTIISIRSSKRCVIVVVTVALFVDHALMSAVVPILPSLLDSIGQTTVSPLKNNTAADTTSIGVLLSCKAFVQLIMNPFVGPITNRLGFNIPLLIGVITVVTSSFVFAFAQSYVLLVASRVLHGLGSAFLNVAGFGVIALKFRGDKERSSAMSSVLTGLAVGDFLGLAFAGFMYQYVNRSSPFLVIGVVALFDAFCQLITMGLTIEKPDMEPKSLKSLLMDPYIMIVAMALALINGGIGMLETALPNWMMETMGSSVWEQGVASLPCTFFYLVGAYCCDRLRHSFGRWTTIMAGLFLMGAALILMTPCRHFYEVLLPSGAAGFAEGLVDSSALPELGRLVDLRHTSVYGNVYVIGDVFPCIGYALMSVVCGVLVDAIGFDKTMYAAGIFIIAYAPVLLFLHNTPSRDNSLKVEPRSPTPEKKCQETKL